MTLWVICGAGRGVGKTHLAQRLGQVLPNAVYAKCGHGQAQAGKPTSFFNTEEQLAAFLASVAESREHIVVESNALARRGEGDIVVFVDGIDGHTNVRSDADVLRAQAHLCVCPGACVRDWQKVLRSKLANERLSGAVCEILTEHTEARFASLIPQGDT